MTERPTVTAVTVTDAHGTDLTDLFAAAFDYSAVTDDRGDDLAVDALGTSSWWDGPEGRGLATREDIQPIVERWIESEHTNGDRLFSWEWSEPWGAYVLPYHDGKTTGFLSINDDGEGKGRMPFAGLIYCLDLTYTVTWSSDSPS